MALAASRRAPNIMNGYDYHNIPGFTEAQRYYDNDDGTRHVSECEDEYARESGCAAFCDRFSVCKVRSGPDPDEVRDIREDR